MFEFGVATSQPLKGLDHIRVSIVQGPRCNGSRLKTSPLPFRNQDCGH